MALAKVEPMPEPVQTFCYGTLRELGVPDLTFTPLNLNYCNLFVQRGYYRYYLRYAIVQEKDIKDVLLGDWKKLRLSAIGFVGWRSNYDAAIVVRSPVLPETFVWLYNRLVVPPTLIANLKGIVAALRIKERFGIPYCVEFVDHYHAKRYGRVVVVTAHEQLRLGVGLVLTCLDGGEVVITAKVGRKVLGHLDPDTILNENWEAVTRWVHSIVVDGVLFSK
jgi:hypothetical protein